MDTTIKYETQAKKKCFIFSQYRRLTKQLTQFIALLNVPMSVNNINDINLWILTLLSDLFSTYGISMLRKNKFLWFHLFFHTVSRYLCRNQSGNFLKFMFFFIIFLQRPSVRPNNNQEKVSVPPCWCLTDATVQKLVQNFLFSFPVLEDRLFNFF